MNSKVKRYAFRLSQLSEVMGGQLEVIEYSGDGLPYVLATDYAALEAENARLRAELEQSRDLIVEMSTHCNATALVADWLERNT